MPNWPKSVFQTGRQPPARQSGRDKAAEFRATPQRAVRNEPTQARGKRSAARRVIVESAVWNSCSVGYSPLQGCCLPLAPRTSPFHENSPPAHFQAYSKAWTGLRLSWRRRHGHDLGSPSRPVWIALQGTTLGRNVALRCTPPAGKVHQPRVGSVAIHFSRDGPIAAGRAPHFRRMEGPP